MRKQLIKSLIVCSGIISIFFISDLYAQSGNNLVNLNSIFKEANMLYKDSLYDQAIAKYEEILKEGFVSGNLYYNLANAYFKKKELGRARLNYERARLFMPTDSDLKANYEFADSVLDLGSEKVNKKWIVRLVDKSFAVFSINALTVFLSLVYASIFLMIILNLYIPRFKKFYRFFIFILMVLFMAGSVCLAGKIDDSKRAAIV